MSESRRGDAPSAATTLAAGLCGEAAAAFTIVVLRWDSLRSESVPPLPPERAYPSRTRSVIASALGDIESSRDNGLVRELSTPLSYKREPVVLGVATLGGTHAYCKRSSSGALPRSETEPAPMAASLRFGVPCTAKKSRTVSSLPATRCCADIG